MTSPVSRPRKPGRWFAVALVALPLFVFGTALWIARTDWFVANATPAYLQWMDAQYSIRNRDCAILIFGDSTALTGIEPRILTQRTGLTACSIAQTRGVVGALGTDLLDRYLRQNPAPQFIVFAFSPDNWHPQKQWDEIAFGEGLFLLLRHYPAGEWLRAVIMHPAISFSFALHVDELILGRSLGKALHWSPMQLGPDPGLELGHMTMNFPAQDHCLSSDLRAPPEPRMPDPVYMAALRAKYSLATAIQPATVLLAVSPIPDCDPQYDWYSTKLAGLLDFPLQRYPIADFNSYDRHFTRAGSQRYSSDLAETISNKRSAAN